MNIENDRSTNKPAKELRRFIKLSNLVPFDAELNFVSPFPAYSLENSFGFWSLGKSDQYPKLFRYLRSIERKKRSWTTAFDDFVKVRDFMKTFTEIANDYQQELAKIKSAVEEANSSGNQFFTNFYNLFTPEELMKQQFHFAYNKYGSLSNATNIVLRSSITARLYQRGYRKELAERLFNAALNFISLRVGENHKAELSFGSFVSVVQNTDLRRLKKCCVCSKIIWAYRLNTQYCSKKCSNLFHQKKVLENAEKTAEINKARRMEYYIKHDIEYCKFCVRKKSKCNVCECGSNYKCQCKGD